jgi:hypothetical protein
VLFKLRVSDFKRQLPRGERLLKSFLARSLPIQWADVLRQDLCAYCGERGGTVDHIHPKSRKGKDVVENLTGACNLCNVRKGRKQLLRFLVSEMERRGRS